MGLQPPASKKEAGTWHERLRLTQEALTLLRGLSVQPQVKDVVLEDHISSAASIRLCLMTAGMHPFGKSLCAKSSYNAWNMPPTILRAPCCNFELC